MATAIATRMATAALHRALRRRGIGGGAATATRDAARLSPASRVHPRVGSARGFATRRSGVAMRGWRMGEGSSGVADETDGGDGDGARPASGWANAGARARGRGANNRSGGSRERRAPPSRRYADDERGDYGSFDDDGFDDDGFDDDGFDRGRGARGGRGGRGSNRGRGNRGGNRGAPRGRESYASEYDDASSFDGTPDGTRTRWQTRHDEKKAARHARGDLTLAERVRGEAVYGRNPVLAMLAARRREEISAVWIQEGSDASRDRALLKAVQARGITPEYASKHDLNMLVGGDGRRPHNGVVADASPLTPTPIDSLPLPAEWATDRAGDGSGSSTDDNQSRPSTSPPVWLALDEIVDPQNLGAVLRSAHFLGVAGVVVCAKNSAPLSPVVSKASSGALERMDVRSVGVMPRFLQRCVEEGWDVFGADNAADAEDVTAVTVARPSVVVVGNEGAGLRTNVRRACNRVVRIEGGGGAERGVGEGGVGEGSEGGDTVDSLNVSVATGILLHSMLTSSRARR